MSTQVDIEVLNDTHLDEIAELTYTTEDFAAFVSLLGLAYLKNVYIKNILEIAFGFVVKIPKVYFLFYRVYFLKQIV